jgi:Recombinase
MKGSMSEFELGVLRARMLDAARAKARRGELRLSVSIGVRSASTTIRLAASEMIHLVFATFRELGSARQVLLSMTADQIYFPRPPDDKKLVTFDWTPIRYRNVISVLKNPFHAGVYAFGKNEKRTEIVDGRARKSYGHGRPLPAMASAGGRRRLAHTTVARRLDAHCPRHLAPPDRHQPAHHSTPRDRGYVRALFETLGDDPHLLGRPPSL